MLIGDCASDPPLGATARALATMRSTDVLFGLGAAAVARGHRQLALAAADPPTRAALRRALTDAAADVQLIEVPDAWPAVAAGARDELLPASLLVAIADEARGRRPSAFVTVAGAVAQPTVLACPPATTMAELVARAGGALEDDWLPIAGGAPAGRLVARDATVGDVGAPSLVLVLPARHGWVRRLRTPVGAWLWRAASACEGCRHCSDACPAALSPHALTATLTRARDDGTAPAAFAACSGCGLCDAACPASLSPRALSVAVRDRLHAGGVDGAAPVARAGLDRALLTLRLGLARYDVAPVVALA